MIRKSRKCARPFNLARFTPDSGNNKYFLIYLILFSSLREVYFKVFWKKLMGKLTSCCISIRSKSNQKTQRNVNLEDLSRNQFLFNKKNIQLSNIQEINLQYSIPHCLSQVLNTSDIRYVSKNFNQERLCKTKASKTYDALYT